MVAEAARRATSRWTHRLESLPILALSVHSACNCRCVMCDIWKANQDRREMSVDELDGHIAAMRALHVQRVMLTGGEPLLHSNLWTLCGRLRDEGIRITLVTTGLLLAQHVDHIAMNVDDLFISIDGDPEVHDGIRQTRGGFDRIARGVALLNNYASRPRTTARSVVQRRNHARLVQTIEAVRGAGLDRLSFLAADVSSTAFNRPEPWTDEKRADIALSRDQLPLLAAAIREVEERCKDAIRRDFLTGGVASLWRIHDYYSALAELREFPAVRCNAPWVSAVLEPGGQLRPCFFHPPYPASGGGALDGVLNAPASVSFRRELRVGQNDTCQRCVCSLSLPFWAKV